MLPQSTLEVEAKLEATLFDCLMNEIGAVWLGRGEEKAFAISLQFVQVDNVS